MTIPVFAFYLCCYLPQYFKYKSRYVWWIWFSEYESHHMVFSSGMWWISLAGKLLRSCCWPDHFQSGTAVELSRLPKVLPYVLRILRRSSFCHEEGQTLEHNNRFVLEHRPPVPLCLCTRSELLEWDCSPGDIYGVTSGSSATPLLGPVWPVGLWKSCGSTRNTLTPVASAELFPHFPFKFSTHGNRGEVGGWYRKPY